MYSERRRGSVDAEKDGRDAGTNKGTGMSPWSEEWTMKMVVDRQKKGLHNSCGSVC